MEVTKNGQVCNDNDLSNDGPLLEEVTAKEVTLCCSIISISTQWEVFISQNRWILVERIDL